MKLLKVTTGFVTQIFDTDQGLFVEQSFTAGDQCDYEDEGGGTVESSLFEANGTEVYLPYNMEQPGKWAKVVWTIGDVQSLRPNWTDEQCEQFLYDNEDYIRDRLTELGHEVIDALLPPKTEAFQKDD
tara:strand:- start:1919 stop:2302 length:384 start_codon:yes stop_codon:yes gene_type:complete